MKKLYSVATEEKSTDHTVSPYQHTVCRDNLSAFLDRYTVSGEELKISTEAIISEKEASSAGVLTRIWHNMVDTKDDILTVFNAFAGYNTSKIEEYLSMIEKGELVPKKEISSKDQEHLQNKLAAFFVLGYSMKSGSKDLIAYMDKPVKDLISGKYDELYSKQLKSIFSSAPEELTKTVKPFATNLDLKKIKMPLKISGKQLDHVPISFLVKRFYHKLYMYSLVVTTEFTGEDRGSMSNPFLNNIDILDIPSKYLEDIKPFNKSEAITLLKYGIKGSRDIKSAISKAKYLFVTYGVKNQLTKTIMGLLPTLTPTFMLLVGRAFNVITTHLGNVSKDMIYYDKFIITIIDAMYERK